MIKIENEVLASPEQMEFIIEGMRNPMNSWEKKDSREGCEHGLCWKTCNFSPHWCGDSRINRHHSHILPMFRTCIGETLHKGVVIFTHYIFRSVAAPLYWWKEFDTYKIGTVANSCSTMHKIAEKEFTLEDFSCEHLSTVSLNYLRNCIEHLNFIRDVYNEDKSNKGAWWQMIQLLPSSYNQTRNVMLNYEVLANIYRQRKNHKLDEWREFCKWIESLPYSELVTGAEETKIYADNEEITNEQK